MQYCLKLSNKLILKCRLNYISFQRGKRLFSDKLEGRVDPWLILNSNKNNELRILNNESVLKYFENIFDAFKKTVSIKGIPTDLVYASSSKSLPFKKSKNQKIINELRFLSSTVNYKKAVDYLADNFNSFSDSELAQLFQMYFYLLDQNKCTPLYYKFTDKFLDSNLYKSTNSLGLIDMYNLNQVFFGTTNNSLHYAKISINYTLELLNKYDTRSSYEDNSQYFNLQDFKQLNEDLLNKYDREVMDLLYLRTLVITPLVQYCDSQIINSIVLNFLDRVNKILSSLKFDQEKKINTYYLTNLWQNLFRKKGSLHRNSKASDGATRKIEMIICQNFIFYKKYIIENLDYVLESDLPRIILLLLEMKLLKKEEIEFLIKFLKSKLFGKNTKESSAYNFFNYLYAFHFLQNNLNERNTDLHDKSFHVTDQEKINFTNNFQSMMPVLDLFSLFFIEKTLKTTRLLFFINHHDQIGLFIKNLFEFDSEKLSFNYFDLIMELFSKEKNNKRMSQDFIQYCVKRLTGQNIMIPSKRILDLATLIIKFSNDKNVLKQILDPLLPIVTKVGNTFHNRFLFVLINSQGFHREYCSKELSLICKVLHESLVERSNHYNFYLNSKKFQNHCDNDKFIDQFTRELQLILPLCKHSYELLKTEFDKSKESKEFFHKSNIPFISSFKFIFLNEFKNISKKKSQRNCLNFAYIVHPICNLSNLKIFENKFDEEDLNCMINVFQMCLEIMTTHYVSYNLLEFYHQIIFILSRYFMHYNVRESKWFQDNKNVIQKQSKNYLKKYFSKLKDEEIEHFLYVLFLFDALDKETVDFFKTILMGDNSKNGQFISLKQAISIQYPEVTNINSNNMFSNMRDKKFYNNFKEALAMYVGNGLIKNNPVYKHNLIADFEIAIDNSNNYVDPSSVKVHKRVPILLIDKYMCYKNRPVPTVPILTYIENFKRLNFPVLTVNYSQLENGNLSLYFIKNLITNHLKK